MFQLGRFGLLPPIGYGNYFLSVRLTWTPLPWQFLYFCPLPHGQRLFGPTTAKAEAGRCMGGTKSISSTEGKRNENMVLPPLLVTAKSPPPIISIPIRTGVVARF